MNSINLTGRLTADPETRSARETDVGHFRLAIQRRRSREGEDRGAVYVDVVTFGGLARSCGEHLSKGRQVAVSGRLELDEGETEGGERRSRHKVVADGVEFLGRLREDA
jgi:single-strand DNA-binding protein